MTLLKKYNNWTSNEKNLFWKATAYLFWARIIILLPAKYWYRYTLLKEVASNKTIDTDNKVKLITRSLVRAVKVAPWQTKCLVRSLAHKKLLEEIGIESQLKLGIMKGDKSELIAHAWLENKLYLQPLQGNKQYSIVN
ncbi:lasso peptide biosynthesis B2 protein [Bacteroidales bacterium]|nr:lasso peptide biosynthesis B2 protein [Bacteroidales bacterium]